MIEFTRRAALAGVAATTLVPLAGGTWARAGAPLADKQAPGFYRYNIGTHQITVVSDGITVAPRADNYVVNASKDEVSKAFADNYLPPDKATHSYNPIVINTGSKLVVVDTGLGPATYEQSKGKAGQFQTNLAAAGIDRNSVDTVIISHFHGDHINGLLTADNKAAYPNAEIMVPSAEWKFWMDDGEMSKGTGNPILEGNFKNSRRVFDALGRKVTQYDAGKELAPGIASVASPGHTPGHTSFVVTSGSEKLLVQVDITAGAAFLFVKNPEWQAVFDVDKPLAVQTRRKLYDMAIAEKMPIQAFHAGFPGLVRVEKDGNGYRWIPALWNSSL
ncbi:MBL fold metallo-hydrolase [Bradyrhizobium sp.]|uniref:MBL fold metallo-hydrolase n=1 Tax=Bradyrhizobium sp. TaxID=376 RepID=UPI0025C43AD4|nr:MBL fold metallo-hydrolase [Bradyrhizobium sp.]